MRVDALAGGILVYDELGEGSWFAGGGVVFVFALYAESFIIYKLFNSHFHFHCPLRDRRTFTYLIPSIIPILVAIMLRSSF